MHRRPPTAHGRASSVILNQRFFLEVHCTPLGLSFRGAASPTTEKCRSPYEPRRSRMWSPAWLKHDAPSQNSHKWLSWTCRRAAARNGSLDSRRSAVSRVASGSSSAVSNPPAARLHPPTGNAGGVEYRQPRQFVLAERPDELREVCVHNLDGQTTLDLANPRGAPLWPVGLVRFGSFTRRAVQAASVTMQNQVNYVQVKQAAELLGVSPNTIRNWGRDSKLPEYRHPLNNYRLFRRSVVAKLVRLLRQPRRASASTHAT